MDSQQEKVRVERYNPEKEYNWDNFDCGVDELNAFIHERMGKELERRVSIPHLCIVDSVDGGPPDVIGYFTLASNSFEKGHLSAKERRKFTYRTVPCILLSKIAVDNSVQGQGIGKWLLSQAIKAAYISSRDVGVYALFLQARDGREDFYHKCGMIQSKSDRSIFIFPLMQYESTLKAKLQKK